ncbi:MAG: hypothetical protein AAB384_00515 [Patescibacteria group bacterium]
MHTFDRNTIRDIQAFLILCPNIDNEHLIGDGVWGEMSRKALTSWQLNKHIHPTGEFDEDTIDELNWSPMKLPTEGPVTTRQVKAMLLFANHFDEDDYIVDNDLNSALDALREFCIETLNQAEGFYLPEEPTDREILCALVLTRGVDGLEVDTSQITDFSQLGEAGAEVLKQFFIMIQRGNTERGDDGVAVLQI